MQRRLLFLFLIALLSATLPLCAKGSNLLSQQYALSLSYMTDDIFPLTGYMKSVLTLDGSDFTAAFRADERGIDIALSSHLSFGAEHGTVLSLRDTSIGEIDRRSFFLDSAAEMNIYPGYGNTYTAALSIGQEIILGKGFYKAGLSYELGIYAHMTTFSGFKGSAFTLNPLYSLGFISNFGDIFFLKLSFITRTLFYYPKQTAYGFRLSSAILATKAFSLGYDGYFFFSDYISETEFINRIEHTLFLSWRFGL